MKKKKERAKMWKSNTFGNKESLDSGREIKEKKRFAHNMLQHGI